MENEKRLIDAYKPEDLVRRNRASYHNKDDVIAAIAGQPSVDAVEVVHGRLGVSYMDEYYGEFANCLECGADNVLPCHYCRNCGAKMDGDGNA